MSVRLTTAFSVLCIMALALAQDRQPAQRGTATATIGGKTITIDYGRPVLKGRSVDELLNKLPPDRVWRAGANQVTILTTGGDVLIGGKRIPAGRYSLYVLVPQQGPWSLLVNKDQGIELVKLYSQAPERVAHEMWPRLDGYEKNIAKEEVARVAMESGSVSSPVDPFTIELSQTPNAATLTMSWGNRSYSVEIKAAE